MEQQRISRVLERMERRGLRQMIVSDPASIRYLTGVDIQPMERLLALYLRRGGCRLFLNRLFTVPPTGLEEVWVSDDDDPVTPLAEAVEASEVLGVDRQWPARYLLPLMERVEGLRCAVASDCVDAVRAVKDEAEQEKMAAALGAQRPVHGGAEELVPRRYDGAGRVWSTSAASTGNTAPAASALTPSWPLAPMPPDPHHVSDGTVVREGDCVLVDTGCVLDGYCSDMTRTYYFRTMTERDRALHDLVREANELAEAAVRPGVPLRELDRIAREHIAAAGYGENFTHRLGHFIGTECHESGDVSATTDLSAEPGMCFSIEPGVYLPGETGVRVEDLVLVTAEGLPGAQPPGEAGGGCRQAGLRRRNPQLWAQQRVKPC